MNTRILLAIASLIITLASCYFAFFNQESIATPPLNSASSILASSNHSSSSAPAEQHADEFEGIKTGNVLREKNEVAHDRLENNDDLRSEDKITSSPTSKVNSESETALGSNKYVRPAINENGEKLLYLPSYSPYLPRLVPRRSLLNCSYSAILPFEEIKKRAEAGDACMDFQYGTGAIANLAMQGVDMTKNREEWKEKLKPYFDYLIKAAVNGDAWSARELGCNYLYPPFEEKVDGLAWFMIASALGGEKYLGIEPCTATLLSEPELTYVLAIERAKFYIDYYNFQLN